MIIAAAIFLAPIMGIEGLAVGVVIGSAGASGHPAAEPGPRREAGYELTINLGHPGVRKVGG